jgi:hypothetical protein
MARLERIAMFDCGIVAISRGNQDDIQIKMALKQSSAGYRIWSDIGTRDGTILR